MSETMQQDSLHQEGPSIRSRGDERPDNSEVVTFYSYKGGVGRSMALANVATLLAREQGRHVIVVDWDLEAPGLHRFFSLSERDLKPGVIDYLLAYKQLLRDPGREVSARSLSIEPYLLPVVGNFDKGSVRLLSAGQSQHLQEYSARVSGFNWDEFYRDWNGAHLIEALRSQLRSLADIVLIDSRTGITDAGGVCTLQLPDVVVFVFTYNEQSLAGLQLIASDLSSGRNPTLAKLQRSPELLFLPSRKELAEIARLREWEKIAGDRLQQFFLRSPRLRNQYPNAEEFFRRAAIPYVPHFAFGEEIAANAPIGFEMTEAFRRFVAILEGGRKSNPGSANARWLPQAISVLAAGAMVVGFAAYLLLGGNASLQRPARAWIINDLGIDAALLPYLTAFGGGAIGGGLRNLYGAWQLARKRNAPVGLQLPTLIIALLGGAVCGLVVHLYIDRTMLRLTAYALYFSGGFLFQSVLRFLDDLFDLTTSIMRP